MKYADSIRGDIDFSDTFYNLQRNKQSRIDRFCMFTFGIHRVIYYLVDATLIKFKQKNKF